ncbi:MAG: ATP-binding protein [Bacteroidales bacterium]|jgi:AAA+ ATPase superfamily predicted ATPase|nr:ATP-binding protein [Bacteroidales bacterium]
MKFYNREQELQSLERIRRLSLSEGQMTVLVGRRRIGKTQLLLKSTERQPTLYFFVTRKAENMLCNDFVEEIQTKLGVPIGSYHSFAKLFEHILLLAKERPFNVIIDEFQEFSRINSSIFSEMQKVWDLHKSTSKINLLISGSIYSLMHKIFEDKKEPLFSRAGQIIHVKSFNVSVLREILADYAPTHSNEDLLALYSFTGGVAWYVELMMKHGAFSCDSMIRLMCEENMPFLSEGKNVLIEEFGKDYTIYFSILECIARGLSTRGEIENHLGNIEIGGYLSRLEQDFSLIRQQRPIFAKPSSKQVYYQIDDNFLTFWFRFIYKYQNVIASGSFTVLEEIIRRDYTTFSGIMLERYFKAHYKEQGKYTDLGQFWDRKGEHEIDLIAVNELEKTAEFIEIKRNSNRVSLQKLQEKTAYFLQNTGECKDYTITYKGLSLEDM